MDESNAEYAFQECLHEIARSNETRLYFVHGTIRGLFDETSGIRSIGVGDFGLGFYTYSVLGLSGDFSRDAAAKWALRKTKGEEQPCLVYVSIDRLEFLNLSMAVFDRNDCENAYSQLNGAKSSGKDVVIGPVAKRNEYGKKVVNGRLPCQFKFEASSVGLLRLERFELL